MRLKPMHYVAAFLALALVLLLTATRLEGYRMEGRLLKEYRSTSGYNYPGSDISNAPATSAEVCGLRCSLTKDCAGFAVQRGKTNQGNRQCYLKSASAFDGSNRKKDGKWRTYIKKDYWEQSMASGRTRDSMLTTLMKKVKVCDDVNGNGGCTEYTVGDYPNLSGMADRAASIYVPQGLKVDVYENANYDGWLGTLRGDNPDLSKKNSYKDGFKGGMVKWQDTISSMKIQKDDQ